MGFETWTILLMGDRGSTCLYNRGMGARYCQGIIYLLPCRVEVIRPIPVVICCVRTLRAIDTGMEPDEGPCPFRKCAQCDPGHQVERATADRPVAIPGVENDITVL